MSARPTAKQWITILIMSLCILGCAVLMNHDRRHLEASTPGELDENYSVETQSRYGVETNRIYHLGYSFEVNGKPYHGSASQKIQPTSADCTVYFDPNHPEINALRKDPAYPLMIAIWMGLGLLAFIASFWLPTGPKHKVPDLTEPIGNGVGDSAGEYLTIAQGHYDATGYVMLTFFVQIILIVWVGKLGAQAITGGHLNEDVVTVGACLVALSYTFGIYWDRWRCIAAYGSQFTSGCMNISILYMPIVVCVYANYRGLLKLKGR